MNTSEKDSNTIVEIHDNIYIVLDEKHGDIKERADSNVSIIYFDTNFSKKNIFNNINGNIFFNINIDKTRFF